LSFSIALLSAIALRIRLLELGERIVLLPRERELACRVVVGPRRVAIRAPGGALGERLRRLQMAALLLHAPGEAAPRVAVRGVLGEDLLERRRGLGVALLGVLMSPLCARRPRSSVLGLKYE
jgi:hypothetical protein